MTPFGRSLSAKVLALVVLMATLPLLAGSALQTYFAMQSAERTASDLLGARADELAGDVDAFNRGIQITVSRLARIPSVLAFLSGRPESSLEFEYERVLRNLQVLASEDPWIRDVVLVNASGLVVITTEPRLRGIDYRFRGYIRDTLAGRAVTSEIYVSLPELGAVPSIAFTCPVLGSDGRVLGAIVLHVRAAAVWDLLAQGSGRAGPGSFSVLYDSYGIRTGHSTSPELVFRPAGTLDPSMVERFVAENRFGPDTRRYLDDVAPVPEFFALARQSESVDAATHLRVRTPVDVAVNLAVARRLSTVPWTLFFCVPEARFHGEAVSIFWSTVAITGLTLLAAAAAATVMARRITRPIRELATAAAALGRGALSTRVKPASRDELGRLGDAFNLMAESLQRSQELLERRVRERTAALEATLARLETARASAEVASRAKSEFLANMSHELRTPLNAVIGFSEILGDETYGPLNERQVRHVTNIHESGRHLLRLVTDILDIAKIESGRTTIRPMLLRPGPLVLGACETIRSLALKRSIDLTAEVPDDLPAVFADEEALRRVVFNLVGNAVKFTPNGGSVRVSASVTGSRLRVAISDTGQGVDPADVDRIFLPFEQGDGSTSREHQGTGLGLTISRRLVELHGGRLSVQSEGRGRGATFAFEIPLDPAGDGPESPDPPETART